MINGAATQGGGAIESPSALVVADVFNSLWDGLGSSSMRERDLRITVGHYAEIC